MLLQIALWLNFDGVGASKLTRGQSRGGALRADYAVLVKKGVQAASFDPHTERHRPIKSLFCLPRGGPLHNLASNCQPHNWEVEYAKAIHVPDYLHPVSPSSIQRSSLILGRKFNFRLQKMLPLKCLFLEPKPPTVPIETNIGVVFWWIYIIWAFFLLLSIQYWN